LVGWKTLLNREALQIDPISEMERLYKTINAATDSDPAALENAKRELVKLQDGDAENLTSYVNPYIALLAWTLDRAR